MNEETSPHRPTRGGGDPWAAFGYLVAGVAFYGFLGWGLGVWLHAGYLTAVGIVVGAALGLALVFHQYGRGQSAHDDVGPTSTTSGPGTAHPGRSTDDRGETK